MDTAHGQHTPRGVLVVMKVLLSALLLAVVGGSSPAAADAPSPYHLAEFSLAALKVSVLEAINSNSNTTAHLYATCARVVVLGALPYVAARPLPAFLVSLQCRLAFNFSLSASSDGDCRSYRISLLSSRSIAPEGQACHS